MKFKSFLNEAKLLDKNLNNILQQVSPKNKWIQCILRDKEPVTTIWRGRNSSKNFRVMIMDSRNEEKPRKSANTTNEFTLIVDNLLSAWKKYPKRGQSFICTSSKTTAEGYGEPYRVLPLDNPIIGVCPSLDMWDSFTLMKEFLDPYDSNVPAFNQALIDLYRIIHPDKDIDSIDSSLSDLTEKLKEIEDSILNNKLPVTRINTKSTKTNKEEPVKYSELQQHLINFTKKNGSLVKVIEHLFDPDSNDFYVCKSDDLIKQELDSDTDHEMWFSGKAILVSNNYWYAFKQAVKDEFNKDKE